MVEQFLWTFIIYGGVLWWPQMVPEVQETKQRECTISNSILELRFSGAVLS